MAARKSTSRSPGKITRELIAALPKSDLHVHLDGSLRLKTLIELAKERRVRLPSSSEEGLLRLVFKRAYKNLPEYLKGFEFTVACLQDEESLERAAYELCWGPSGSGSVRLRRTLTRDVNVSLETARDL